MAGKEGSPKKDDGAGGSSKPAPVGGGSSPVSTDPVENPDTVLQDVPGDATVAEQGKGSGSAPSTGSAAADKGGEVGQGSHGKGKEVVAAQSSAVPGDVSAHDGKGGDGGASNIERMTALVADLPRFPPAQGPPPAPPQAPLVLDKGKAKRKSDGQGSRTRSKTTKGPDPRTKDDLWLPTAAGGPQIADPLLLDQAAASAVRQGVDLQSPLARIPVPSAPLPLPPRFQPGAELCLGCHQGPAITSLFAGHNCLCTPCRLIIQANPMSTPCQVCHARLIAHPPQQ